MNFQRWSIIAQAGFVGILFLTGILCIPDAWAAGWPMICHGGNGLRDVEVVLETRDFRDPKVEGFALDKCKRWGQECGQPAADEFCRRNSYTRAESGERRGYLVEEDYGRTGNPTKIIGTGQLCRADFCDRISFVRCLRTVSGFDFRPGRRGALETPPEEGVCTWTDRGLRSGEPTRVIFQSSHPEGSAIESVGQAIGDILRYRVAKRERRLFKMHCENRGDHFACSNFEFWTPPRPEAIRLPLYGNNGVLSLINLVIGSARIRLHNYGDASGRERQESFIQVAGETQRFSIPSVFFENPPLIPNVKCFINDFNSSRIRVEMDNRWRNRFDMHVEFESAGHEIKCVCPSLSSDDCVPDVNVDGLRYHILLEPIAYDGSIAFSLSDVRMDVGRIQGTGVCDVPVLREICDAQGYQDRIRRELLSAVRRIFDDPGLRQRFADRFRPLLRGTRVREVRIEGPYIVITPSP